MPRMVSYARDSRPSHCSSTSETLASHTYSQHYGNECQCTFTLFHNNTHAILLLQLSHYKISSLILTSYCALFALSYRKAIYRSCLQCENSKVSLPIVYSVRILFTVHAPVLCSTCSVAVVKFPIFTAA